jgi:hypothetical protein
MHSDCSIVCSLIWVKHCVAGVLFEYGDVAVARIDDGHEWHHTCTAAKHKGSSSVSA